jgi:hypothetical protein
MSIEAKEPSDAMRGFLPQLSPDFVLLWTLYMITACRILFQKHLFIY